MSLVYMRKNKSHKDTSDIYNNFFTKFSTNKFLGVGSLKNNRQISGQILKI